MATAVALINLAWASATTLGPPILALVTEGVSPSATFLIVGPLAVVSACVLRISYRQTARTLPETTSVGGE